MRRAGYLDYSTIDILGNSCELNNTKYPVNQNQAGGRHKKKSMRGGQYYSDADYQVFDILRKLVDSRCSKARSSLLCELSSKYPSYFNKLIAKESKAEKSEEIILPDKLKFLQDVLTPKRDEKLENINQMKLFDLADHEFMKTINDKKMIVNMPIYDYISGADDFTRTTNSRELRYKVYKLFSELADLQKTTHTKTVQIYCTHEGGSPSKEYVIYNGRKYVVRYNKRTKYIIAKKVPMLLKDIKYQKA